MEQFNDKNAKDLATFQARIEKHLAILTDLVTEQGKLKEEDIILFQEILITMPYL